MGRRVKGKVNIKKILLKEGNETYIYELDKKGRLISPPPYETVRKPYEFATNSRNTSQPQIIHPRNEMAENHNFENEEEEFIDSPDPTIFNFLTNFITQPTQSVIRDHSTAVEIQSPIALETEVMDNTNARDEGEVDFDIWEESFEEIFEFDDQFVL